MIHLRNLQAKSGLSEFETARPFLERELVAPRDEFLGRPSKNFRGELVRLAYEMASGAPVEGEAARLCDEACRLLEELHAGSLVVDDIQDGSLFRRGKETLHRMYGVPRAINVGNWLYFDALDSISDWRLDPYRYAAVVSLCHRALNRAHLGQGLDLGVSIDKVDRPSVATICLASLELKTGALTALAFGIGAALAGASGDGLEIYLRLGREFGIALQMFDDLGNLQEKKVAGGQADGKQFEDLKLRRPSWVWATAAEHYGDDGFRRFVEAVERLPETAALLPMLRELIPSGQNAAERSLDRAVERFSGHPLVNLPVMGTKHLETLVARLKGAYLGKPI